MPRPAVSAERPSDAPPLVHFRFLELVNVAAGADHQRPEADIAFEQPWEYARWPDVPTTVLAGRDDRFFPVTFQRRVARERLGVDAAALPGGHLNALSRPEAFVRAVLRG